jgi:hypothetical protein
MTDTHDDEVGLRAFVRQMHTSSTAFFVLLICTLNSIIYPPKNLILYLRLGGKAFFKPIFAWSCMTLEQKGKNWYASWLSAPTEAEL